MTKKMIFLEDEAVEVIHHTIVGTGSSTYPMTYGNCFSVKTSDGRNFRIVNFVYENLEEALRRGRITWPIKIRVLAPAIAVIHDERIPDPWYSSGFCEVCCPKSLLPVPQLLAHDRQIARGDREEKNGMLSIKIPGLRWDK